MGIDLSVPLKSGAKPIVAASDVRSEIAAGLNAIEGRSGYSVNGRGGAVRSANWRSGTRLTTATGQNVRFSPHATFDLGLFMTLDPRFKFVAKHPWLEGASIHLDVRNLFNGRPDARDRFGGIPPGFQPDVLDPVGRMIGITFRKGSGGAGG